MKRPLKNALILAIYIGVTVGLYYLICRLNNREFSQLHLLYAALVGCLAYLPRFIDQWKSRKRR